MDLYIGQIILLAFGESRGSLQWLLPCDGRTLQVSSYEALYAVIGTTWGGDGTRFALPNLTAPSPSNDSPGSPTELCYYICCEGIYPEFN